MRILAYISILVSSFITNAIASDIPEKDEFISERNLSEKELTLYCYQAMYKYIENYGKVISVYPEYERAENLTEAHEDLKHWKKKVYEIYDPPQEAEKALPLVGKKYSGYLNKVNREHQGSVIYLVVYLEFLSCQEIVVLENLKRDRALLESLKK